MKHTQQHGIGLLELMLSVIAIVVLLLLAMRYYGVLQVNSQVNQAVKMVHTIQAGSQRWQAATTSPNEAHQPGKLSIAALIAGNYVPKTFRHNPWGGEVEVQSMPENTIKIIFTHIPVKACHQLVHQFPTQSKATDCGEALNKTTAYSGVFE